MRQFLPNEFKPHVRRCLYITNLSYSAPATAWPTSPPFPTCRRRSSDRSPVAEEIGVVWMMLRRAYSGKRLSPEKVKLEDEDGNDDRQVLKRAKVFPHFCCFFFFFCSCVFSFFVLLQSFESWGEGVLDSSMRLKLTQRLHCSTDFIFLIANKITNSKNATISFNYFRHSWILIK